MALNDLYLTTRGVALMLGVTRQTVYLWSKNGQIVSEKVGGNTFYRKSEIEKLRCPECGQCLIRKSNLAKHSQMIKGG